jgi:hypothetical protein
MAKVWIPDEYDEYGILETPGHFEGEDDPIENPIKDPIKDPIDRSITVTPPKLLSGPTAGEWTTDEMGNPYRIVNGSVEFKDDKGTIFKYDTDKGGFVDSKGNLAGGGNSSLVNAIKNFFTKADGSLDLSKLGLIGGGIAGAMGASTATTKPTGYQGGIPDLVATQPMLTAPPTGRRAGSGGINYGTGVQYKDSKGNIVSDTSTSVADLTAAAKANPYNQLNTYGQVVTPVAPTPFTFTPAAPRTSAAPPPPPPPPPQPTSGGIANLTTNTPQTGVNSGIATGIDPSHPWSKASSDPKIRAIQNELEKLSQTKGTPEQRQAVLDQFLHSTKYTPAQLSAASNGMWGVQDLIDQMQGNTNVFNAQTPWSVYSTKADIKGVQDALQQLSQTKGTPEQRQAVLQNFLKTTNYTPAQLAAASNGMWSVSDLTAQMASNPVLTDLNKRKISSTTTSSSQAGGSNAPTGGGFTAGGGGPMSKADYDKAVAIETARRNAEQAKLDAYHVAPDSPLYKYVQNPSLIPHQYGETDAQAVARVKSQDMERMNTEAYRSTLANASPGGGFVVSGGYLGYDPKPNETNTTVQDANGQSRYMTKAEAAAQEKAQQQYLMQHGNIIDTEHPWNIASTEASTQSAQQALEQLNKTTGTPAERQAALNNFLKTTTFTPEQLSAASNGQWAVSDLKTQMAGNTNQPDTRTGYDDPNQAQIIQEQGGPSGGDIRSDAGLAALAGQISTPMTGASAAGIQKTGIQELDPNSTYQNPGDPAKLTVAPNPFVTGEQPPLLGLAALNAAAQNTYGRALTDSEQQALSGKSLEDAQSIMQQSMDNWKAEHPQGMAAGGLTNLDHGGFVIPADVVSHFGNGSSSAGLELLAQNMGAKPIKGDGDGMSDSIPAAIDGREKALVANDEAYLSPQMVERLGDGDMDAGSRKLKQMMEKIRQARTGSKEQGKQINPNKFMPGGTVGYSQGGGIKRYAGTDPTGSLVTAGVTGTEQNLSNYIGPYASNMLGKTQALANTPYQAYTGPLTAGESGLQNLAFQNAGNLSVPSSVGYAGQQMAQIGDQAQKSSYDAATFGNQFQAPTLSAATDFTNQFQAPTPYQNTDFTANTFDSGAAQQYMNPYLQQSLNPQLEEARRQSEITQQQNNAAMTKAGAFGGGRQAILTSENQRNLGTNQANITGLGYNTAYTNAMNQFNSDQARNMQAQQAAEQSRQFGANQSMTAAQMMAQYGLSAQQAQEQARQFNQQQNMTSAQSGAQYGLAGQQAGEQSRQFGANYGNQNLNTALQAAQGLGNLGIASGGLSLQNLQQQAALGATQRGIESEGIAADKAQFEEARKDPYSKLQFQQSMVNGLPITATNYNMSQPSTFTAASQGATTLAQLLKNLGIGG